MSVRNKIFALKVGQPLVVNTTMENNLYKIEAGETVVVLEVHPCPPARENMIRTVDKNTVYMWLKGGGLDKVSIIE